MEKSVTITIGGVKRHIASYESLLIQEPANLLMDRGPLEPFQYLSMLFSNLGYSKCPKDFLWLEKDIPIEQVAKTEVFDYPITDNKLMLINKPTSLHTVLTVISNWILDETEKGRLGDERSFELPEMEEMKYYYQNNIKILRRFAIEKDTTYWNKSDVFTRRMHNLNPALDSEYFEYSLTDMFEEVAKVILVPDPSAVFVSALIDPDIIMSAIRQAEKQATHTVQNRNVNIPTVFLDFNQVVSEFARLMTIRFNQISNIYRYRGAAGFINPEKERMRNSKCIINNELKVAIPYDMTEADLNNIRIIWSQIAMTVLDGEHIGVVKTYIDTNSLKFVDRMGENNPTRQLTYKRLYYELANTLPGTYPELLNPKDKLILSEGFFIDWSCFALYKRSKNEFYIFDPYFKCTVVSPQQAIAYYGETFGKRVLLNPNEVGPNSESPICPDLDIDMLEINALGLYGQQTIEIMPPQQPLPSIPESVELRNDVPMYSMPHLVEGA